MIAKVNGTDMYLVVNNQQQIVIQPGVANPDGKNGMLFVFT